MLHAPRVAICLAVAVLWLAACQPQQPTPVPAWPTLTPSATATVRPSAPPPTPTAPAPTATPAPSEDYPPPTPAPTAPALAYPEPVEAEVVQGRAIAILALQPGPDSVRVSGSTTLANEVCIQTWLYADGRLVSWWPTAQCASVRDGRWVLTFERPALGEQAPPGARYTVIAKSLAHPEAGEARLVLQAFIPYHGGGN